MMNGSDMISRIHNEIIPYLPLNLKNGLYKLAKPVLFATEEIRLRAQRPVMVHFAGMDGYINEDGNLCHEPHDALVICAEEMAETIFKICENSWYAYQEDINKGFITIRGGHRIGLIGTPVMNEGRIINIRDISSINIRIAREVKGCANNVIKYLIKNSADIYSTLIISPPGLGKTTLLRDITRLLSNGFPPDFHGLKIGVVDERGEIAASYKGIPVNDLGFRTDIINGIHKKTGMEILLRSMGPNIIALDELGNPDDVLTVLEVLNAGIRLLATAHGYNLKSLKMRHGFNEILNENAFERFIILSLDEDLKYRTTIMDGDGNVLAMVSENDRKPFGFREFNNGGVCFFPQVNRKNRKHTANTSFSD